MKKFLVVILIITMALSCCACGNEDYSFTVPIVDVPLSGTATDVSPGETSSEETIDMTEFIQANKYSQVIALDKKQILMSVDLCRGFDSYAELWLEWEQAQFVNDYKSITDLIEKEGHIIVSLPYNEQWSYEFTEYGIIEDFYDECTIWGEESKAVILISSINVDADINIKVDEFVFVQDTAYKKHAGSFYTWEHEGTLLHVYMGKANSGVEIVIYSENMFMLEQLLNDLQIDETGLSSAQQLTPQYKETLLRNNIVFINTQGTALLTLQNDTKYHAEAKYDSIQLTEHNSKFVVRQEDGGDVIKTIRMDTNNLKAEDITCIDTTNCFGYVYSLTDSTICMAIDKNTGYGVSIKGNGTKQEAVDILKDIDIIHRAYDEEVDDNSKSYTDIGRIGELYHVLTLWTEYNNGYEQWSPYIQKNYSCYVSDIVSEQDKESHQDINTGYTIDDSWRTQDGTYVPAGEMQGITITFHPTITPDGQCVYVLKNGIINQLIGGTDPIDKIEGLCPFIEQIIGETIPVESTKYKGVPLTVFISITEDGVLTGYSQFGGANIQ